MATSRERVLTAIHLAEPDRVPMDFHANPWVMERLHRDLGTTTHRELLQRLRSDIVDLRGTVDPIYRGPVPQSRELTDGVRENLWGWRQRVTESATGPDDCFVELLLADATTIDDFERHRWPSPDWFDFSDFAARLAQWQDFAVMASGASVFQHASFLRGIENLLTDMATQPEMAHRMPVPNSDRTPVALQRMSYREVTNDGLARTRSGVVDHATHASPGGSFRPPGVQDGYGYPLSKRR